MIRMIQSKSAGHAKTYFSDALLKSDYYTNDQELSGFWQGKLAARLGLSGMATKEQFFALCENQHPETLEPLTPRTKEGRTNGYDINFHCPKSVSVLHALSKDNHILDAFQECVSETMNLIEQDCKTRVRKNGVNEERKTGELVWAQFVHQTARPVEGFRPDPHLHSHCFVFNATWDDAEQKMKAGQFREIKKDMPFYQAHFHKVLSDRLMSLGYQIEQTDKSFEIAGVPKKVIDLFSKRTDEIGRIAKEKNITDAKEKDQLGARSRAKKQKGTSMEELKKEWLEQIREASDGKGDMGKTVRFAPKPKDQEIDAEQCINYALDHCFERASVMSARDLLKAAYKFGMGKSSVSAQEITDSFRNEKKIIQIQEGSRLMCTTKEVLKEEKRMVDLAVQSIGKMKPLYEIAPAIHLEGQQKEAIQNILTSKDRVCIVRGAAGSGKTTLLKELVGKMNEANKEVYLVAPTASASRDVLRNEGFQTADTVARLLIDKDTQEKLKNQILIVDEAGLLGTKDMVALLELTAKNNARLILSGDTRQHASVVRGDALRVLNKVAGIQPAEVNKIFRQQKEEYRHAVEYLAKGDVNSAFRKLDDISFIKQIDENTPYKGIVDSYIEKEKNNEECLVIAPTHAEGDKLTQALRLRLKEENMIGSKDVEVQQFKNLNFTTAQKSDGRNLKIGNMVQFSQNAPGFNRGSIWFISNTDKEFVEVKNDKGEVKTLPLKNSQLFDVYSLNEISLAKNDKVRITKGTFDKDKKRLETGKTLEVLAISKSEIVLQNPQSKIKYTLDRSFGHLAYAHCMTSHASQGKTVQHVFIWQPAETFPATDAKQFYVSVSRGKQSAMIYTNNKKELLEHAMEAGDRRSATELISKSDIEKGWQIFKEQDAISLNFNRQTLTAKQKDSYEPDI